MLTRFAHRYGTGIRLMRSAVYSNRYVHTESVTQGDEPFALVGNANQPIIAPTACHDSDNSGSSMQEGPPPARNHASSWRYLRHLDEWNKRTIEGPTWSAREAFDMDDGVIALGENAVDFSEAIMHFDLVQGKTFSQTVAVNESQGKVVAIALALRAHELIATVDEDFSLLSLYQFSTGKPHPLAQRPHIHLPRIVIPPRKHDRRFEQAQIEVCGPRLLIRLCTYVSFGPSKLIVVNWWTGDIVATLDLGSDVGGGFSFIANNMVLNTSASSGVMRILRLPEVNQGKTRSSKPDVLLTLGLPPLKPECSYTNDTKCRAKPALIGEVHPGSPEVIPQRWRSEFTQDSSSEDALIKVVLPVEIVRKKVGRYIYVPVCDYMDYSLLVHRSSLVKLVEQKSDPSSNASSTHRYIAWEEWGPQVAHLYHEQESAALGFNLPLHYNVHGQRAVIAEPHRTILRDFSPHSVELARKRSESQSNDTDPGITVAIVDSPYTLANEVFTQPVTCNLPYVETVKEHDNSQYDDVLLGEDCIIGTRGDKKTSAIASVDVYSI